MIRNTADENAAARDGDAFTLLRLYDNPLGLGNAWIPLLLPASLVLAAGALAATANETFEGVFLNYIWSPIRNVTYGIEAGYHTREQVNGDDGDAVRIQGMVQYSF